MRVVWTEQAALDVERIAQDNPAEQREQRTELRDVRSLLLAQVDHRRRAERRTAELRYDLELMLKSELIGRSGNFETRISALEAGQRPS